MKRLNLLFNTGVTSEADLQPEKDFDEMSTSDSSSNKDQEASEENDIAAVDEMSTAEEETSKTEENKDTINLGNVLNASENLTTAENNVADNDAMDTNDNLSDKENTPICEEIHITDKPQDISEVIPVPINVEDNNIMKETSDDNLNEQAKEFSEEKSVEKSVDIKVVTSSVAEISTVNSKSVLASPTKSSATSLRMSFSPSPRKEEPVNNRSDVLKNRRSVHCPPAMKYRLMCQCGAANCRKYLY